MKNILIFSLAVLLFLNACNGDDLSFSEQLQADLDEIEQYLNDNNLNATLDADRSIYHDIEVAGTGDSPDLSNIVEAKYKGFFLDGTVFDETLNDATVKFPINQVIEGWQLSLPLLKRGGKGTFYLPSGLAYGPAGSRAIEPNTILAFDIELVDFDRPYEEQLPIDLGVIDEHLATNDLTATYDEELEIYHNILEEGTGGSPTVNNTVEVTYKGMLLDGTVFDERTTSIEFPLSGVIEGWQRAIPLLQKGGKGTFYLPSGLAYGFLGTNGIPTNANLIFEVELIDFR